MKGQYVPTALLLIHFISSISAVYRDNANQSCNCEFARARKWAKFALLRS